MIHQPSCARSLLSPIFRQSYDCLLILYTINENNLKKFKRAFIILLKTCTF